MNFSNCAQSLETKNDCNAVLEFLVNTISHISNNKEEVDATSLNDAKLTYRDSDNSSVDDSGHGVSSDSGSDSCSDSDDVDLHNDGYNIGHNENEEFNSAFSDGEDNMFNKFDVEKKPSHQLSTKEQIRAKGEIFPEELPPLEELTITVDEGTELVHFGTVTSIVDTLVVIQSIPGVPALNEGTVLFTEERRSLGRIFEIFGPVVCPCYTVRFNGIKDIERSGVRTNTKVYCALQLDCYTKFVFISQLKRIKGSDASWIGHQEPPSEFLDYSDDEKEKAAKSKRRKQRVSFKRPFSDSQLNSSTNSQSTAECSREWQQYMKDEIGGNVDTENGSCDTLLNPDHPPDVPEYSIRNHQGPVPKKPRFVADFITGRYHSPHNFQGHFHPSHLNTTVSFRNNSVNGFQTVSHSPFSPHSAGLSSSHNNFSSSYSTPARPSQQFDQATHQPQPLGMNDAGSNAQTSSPSVFRCPKQPISTQHLEMPRRPDVRPAFRICHPQPRLFSSTDSFPPAVQLRPPILRYANNYVCPTPQPPPLNPLSYPQRYHAGNQACPYQFNQSEIDRNWFAKDFQRPSYTP